MHSNQFYLVSFLFMFLPLLLINIPLCYLGKSAKQGEILQEPGPKFTVSVLAIKALSI